MKVFVFFLASHYCYLLLFQLHVLLDWMEHTLQSHCSYETKWGDRAKRPNKMDDEDAEDDRGEGGEVHGKGGGRDEKTEQVCV